MKSSKYLAAASAVGMLMFATASHAGGIVITTTTAPPSATAGTNVTISTSITTTCANDAVATFTDSTNGNAALCMAALTDGANPTTGSCVGTFGGAPGAHTVNVAFSSASLGACNALSSAIGTHTVTAAAVVPTLAEWAMWGFAGLLLMFGAGLAARRARRAHGDDGFSAG